VLHTSKSIIEFSSFMGAHSVAKLIATNMPSLQNIGNVAYEVVLNSQQLISITKCEPGGNYGSSGYDSRQFMPTRGCTYRS
jgi:hypothetical protein